MRTKINSVAELQEGRQYVAAFPSCDLAVEFKDGEWTVLGTYVNDLMNLGGIEVFDVTPEPEVLLEWKVENETYTLRTNGSLEWGMEDYWAQVEHIEPIAQEIMRLRERVKELEGK